MNDELTRDPGWQFLKADQRRFRRLEQYTRCGTALSWRVLARFGAESTPGREV